MNFRLSIVTPFEVISRWVDAAIELIKNAGTGKTGTGIAYISDDTQTFVAPQAFRSSRASSSVLPQAVSYTHLDVYKRQLSGTWGRRSQAFLQ